MARAVPGLLAAVPVHDAAQVGADRGQRVQPTRRVPVEGELLEAFAYHGAFTSLDVGDLINLARRRKVGVVCGDLEVFACEGANGLQRLTRRIVEVGPRIGATFDEVRDQEAGDGTMSSCHCRYHRSRSAGSRRCQD